ncbi:MAG TPA: hypothetical protein VLX58_02525 [Bryobacteraceae bacterium]|nr:hypothetical protein [Bryobacteraceae bacterium]
MPSKDSRQRLHDIMENIDAVRVLLRGWDELDSLRNAVTAELGI